MSAKVAVQLARASSFVTDATGVAISSQIFSDKIEVAALQKFRPIFPCTSPVCLRTVFDDPKLMLLCDPHDLVYVSWLAAKDETGIIPTVAFVILASIKRGLILKSFLCCRKRQPDLPFA